MRLIHFLTASLLAAPISILGCAGDTSTDNAALSGEQGHTGASDDCTLTQGYWKNHPDAWPVDSLKLGSVTYTKIELLAIFHAPVKGNGLIQLAHQLIAAKLNVAAGAANVEIKAVIDQADALIGSLVCPPSGDATLKASATAALTEKLDAFNRGEIGPGHCGDNDGEGEGSGCGSTAVCGDGIVDSGEACDDGNTVAHDGCSPTCTIEVPVCGNGYVEVGESCDDGNLVNGDGCSSACTCECPNH